MLKKILNSKKDVNKMARGYEPLIELTEKQRREFQLCLLEIYKDVKQVCDKYGIRVFLIGGSALGAVRHKGFIPWDDDMDVLMTREEYERFKTIFEKELSDKYILNAPNYSKRPINRWPVIMKKNTYYRRVIDVKDEKYHLIYIDVNILENIPDNEIHRRIKAVLCTFFSMVSWEVFIWENRNRQIKEFLLRGGLWSYYLRIIIGFLFSFMPSCSWFNFVDRLNQYKNSETKDCCIAAGRKKYLGEVMKRSQWLPGKEGSFEGEKVLLFSDTDAYLRNLYGDYMKIPPKEDRERHLTYAIRYGEVNVQSNGE